MKKINKCKECNQIMMKLNGNIFQCPKCDSIENNSGCEICGNKEGKCQHEMY